MTRSSGRVIRGRFRRRRRPLRAGRPFAIWRRPVSADSRLRMAVAQDLGRIALIEEPRWPRARAGDPAAAIGVAVDTLWDREVADDRRDLILTALWLAAGADGAALLVLEMLRIRLSLQRSA